MRLNNIHRETIANRAAKSDAFTARETELEHRGNVLATRVMMVTWTLSTIDMAAKLGPKWVNHRTQMKVNVAGAQVIMRFKEPTPLPMDQYDIVATVQPGSLSDEIMTWANDKETLKADREKAKRAVWAMLNSVSTVETLASVWPEGQQFYAYLEVRKPDLPSIVGTDINKLLGVA